MTKPETNIPPGFMQDARGALWPVETIKEIDIARDELVREIVVKAQAVSSTLAHFKIGVFGDIEAFVALSGEKYGAKMGGIKGNVTLLTFDGRYKIQRAVFLAAECDKGFDIAEHAALECGQHGGHGAGFFHDLAHQFVAGDVDFFDGFDRP